MRAQREGSTAFRGGSDAYAEPALHEIGHRALRFDHVTRPKA